MGVMSDLDLLSDNVLYDGKTVPEVAEKSGYNEEDIAWAVAEKLKIRVERHD